MKPTKQTIYLPVKVEDEFPNEECVMISKTHDMLVGYAADVNGEIQADDAHQILRHITHWLKSQEAFVLTPEQLNKYTQSVIKQSLETAAENAEYNIDGQEHIEKVWIDKQSITNTFEETYRLFSVD